MMLRAAVIAAVVCAAFAANVLPIGNPAAGLSVSFAQNLKTQNDEICKICIQESVVMYARHFPLCRC